MEYKEGTVVLDGWKITRPLGEGAFGQVFEIQKEIDSFDLAARSALKVISIPQSQSDIRTALSEGMDEKSVTAYFRGFVEEIVREIAVMTTLKSHPNIVSYEDHYIREYPDEIRWDILIRMELLTPLIDYQRDHPMGETEVVRMGRELCDALVFCQRKGLIHRDIKPENIFVSETGQFKLGDFGVARTVEKTTGGLSKKGTESYMAPEVYLGQPYGQSVDLYALGLVLYRGLNGGRLPFLPPYPQPITFADRQNALVKRMRGDALPPLANASDGIFAVIRRACAFASDDRYKSAAEMKANLDACAGQAPQSVQPDVCAGQAPQSGQSDSWAQSSAETVATDATVGGWGQKTPPQAEPLEGTMGSWGEKVSPRAKTPESTKGNWGRSDESDFQKFVSGGDSQAATDPMTANEGAEEASRPEDFICAIDDLDLLALHRYTGQASVVTIPDDVKYLGELYEPGNRVFEHAEKVRRVILPENLDGIYENAFLGCENLESIVFPASLGLLFCKFGDCKNLKSVEFKSPSEYGAGNEIVEGLFAGCVSLKHVSLPEGASMQYISPSMFEGCTSLQEITIPRSVIGIYKDAFKNCKNLRRVNLPNHEMLIHPSAFEGCPYQPPVEYTRSRKVRACPICGGKLDIFGDCKKCRIHVAKKVFKP